MTLATSPLDTEVAAELSIYGGQAFIKGDESLKLSTPVFKRVSLLIGGPSMSIGLALPGYMAPFGAGPAWIRHCCEL